MKTAFALDSTEDWAPMSKRSPTAGRRQRRKKRCGSSRSCRMCGKDPHPNYFYCPACHHRISSSGGDELGDYGGPEW